MTNKIVAVVFIQAWEKVGIQLKYTKHKFIFYIIMC